MTWGEAAKRTGKWVAVGGGITAFGGMMFLLAIHELWLSIWLIVGGGTGAILGGWFGDDD